MELKVCSMLSTAATQHTQVLATREGGHPVEAVKIETCIPASPELPPVAQTNMAPSERRTNYRLVSDRNSTCPTQNWRM